MGREAALDGSDGSSPAEDSADPLAIVADQ